MLLLLACTSETYDVVDLQLDVDGAVVAGTELTRTCITGVGYREEGAGVGRLATPGIPEILGTEGVVVQVDLLDADGVLLLSTEPATLTLDNPYVVTGIQEAGNPAENEVCLPEGSFAKDTEASLLLGVRFLDAPW